MAVYILTSPVFGGRGFLKTGQQWTFFEQGEDHQSKQDLKRKSMEWRRWSNNESDDLLQLWDREDQYDVRSASKIWASMTSIQLIVFSNFASYGKVMTKNVITKILNCWSLGFRSIWTPTHMQWSSWLAKDQSTADIRIDKTYGMSHTKPDI